MRSRSFEPVNRLSIEAASFTCYLQHVHGLLKWPGHLVLNWPLKASTEDVQ